MAEETPMSPINETVPPKANPLAMPATAHPATLKLEPEPRPAPSAATTTQSALKPGLKLPPKPGLATGLKLPPKPGSTLSTLKPGIRLPTQSGLKPGIKLPTQSGLKPGVNLPARPMIRKPGATVRTPVPPVAAPSASAPKAEQPKPMETLKTITQNLKSITSPIPQQAILRKTGIIADAEMTEAQKQAAKAKTARISLSDAMGVAPVKNEALPMKTIRIKRPVDIPGATGTASASAPAAPAPTVSTATEPAKTVDTQADTKLPDATTTSSFTQRKTLKISRPGGGAVRPTGKFGVKKTVSAAAKPAATDNAVADIPDMPSAAPVPLAAKDLVPDVPKGVATTGLLIQIAACCAMAFLGWLLYQNTQLPLYCGGCL